MKNSLSNGQNFEIWKGVRLIGPWRWILSRGIFGGCFAFTLRTVYDVLITFRETESLPNWKVMGDLFIWLPTGIAWAALVWRRKERAFMKRAVEEQSGGQKN